jgi:hypothetical protein
MKNILIILFSVCTLAACRYGRPLLAVPEADGRAVDIGSIGQREVSRAWHFICLRSGVHIGEFIITRTYDKNGRFIEKDREKNTWSGCCDLPSRLFTQEIKYDSLGQKKEVNYSVEQNGYAVYPLSGWTDYYKNGVKIRSSKPRRRQVITLHPDTTDKYIVVFRCDTPDGPSYNILMGYSAFKNSNQFGHDDSKAYIIKTIDKYIKNKARDTIVLNADTMNWFYAKDLDSWIGNEIDGVIHELLDSGNVKIYDIPGKKYLKQVLKRKERWRSHGCFARHGISWFYRDVKTHKEIMEFEIDDKRIIRARF